MFIRDSLRAVLIVLIIWSVANSAIKVELTAAKIALRSAKNLSLISKIQSSM